MKQTKQVGQTESLQKISVLHVTTRLDHGGIEIWLLNILKHYDRKKFKMDVCLIGRRGKPGKLAEEYKATGCRIKIVPLRNPIHFYRHFRKISNHYQVIMLSTNIYLAPIVLFSTYLSGVQHRLLMLHSTYYSIPTNFLGINNSKWVQLFLKPFFNVFNRILSSGIMGCSKSALSSFNPNWQKHKKYKLLNLGIDTRRFIKNEENNEIRESLAIPKEYFVIGHVGRFTPAKNHLQFLKVAKRLVELFPKVYFVLVGDGPLRQEIELLINQMGLSNHFHLTGVRSDVPDLMTVMDIAFFPSLHEGFPVTFIEAQVSGLVVVTGLRSELQESICPENHPFCLVNTTSVEACSQKILYLLNHSDIREKIENLGRVWSIDRFSIQKSVSSLETNIEQYFQQV